MNFAALCKQQKALHLQNKALTFGLLAFFIPPLLGAIVLHLVGTDAYSEEVKGLFKTYAFFLSVGVTTVIAFSSIIFQASIFNGGHRKEFAKGKTAINEGLGLLLIVVIALLIWFGK